MTRRPVLSARFVDGSAGPLFVLRIVPGHCTPKACLLLLPPFAEEMNRSRKMMAAIGRTLALQGFAVQIADTYGTGDSGGSFEQASWNGWMDDVAILCRHARIGTEPLWLGGIRTGALLVACQLQRAPEGIAGALMIQPILNGALFLTQFLRLRVAAAMNRGERESAGALKKLLEEGENVTISGYTLAPALALQMAQHSFKSLSPPDDLPIEWIETGPFPRETDDILSGIPENWRAQPSMIKAHYVQGEAFWAMPEPVAPKGLLDLITQRMESHLP